ncbi:erythromycin esterase family protein [Pedobacter aquatilis]|uniref:erythromycin esterase family protein n=1 Tax=Pedobacter aquatilis TaxID=351343 RepID=UPI00292E8A24|nr:erythromycin esterase family protein [Pedobacter aquatilis]
MIRRYFLSILFLSLCTFLNNVSFAQNVVNGGFELSNQNGMARNWITDDAKGKFKIILNDKEVRSGKYSLEINGNGTVASGSGIVANIFGAGSSTKVNTVQLTGWIKSNTRIDSSVSLFIQRGSKIIRYNTKTKFKKGWNKLVLNYTIPGGESWYRFYYGMEVNSNTRVLLDDVALIVNGVRVDDPNSLYRKPTQKQVQWLANSLSPIAGLKAGHLDNDLVDIGKAIGDARIIGVGEPTHGTSEVSTFKLRLLEFMVNQKGVTTIALEESIATCDQMNSLVNEKVPALTDSLLSMPFYKLWKTQEMLSLFNWITEYNLSHVQKLRFTGFDMEDLGLKNSRKMLRDYGSRNDVAIHHQTLLVDKDLESLLLLSRESMDNEKTMTAAKLVKKDLTALDSLIVLEGENIGKQTIFELQSYLRVCKQWIENRFFVGSRDEFMADNIKVFLDAHPGEKVFLWAHNFHVANANTGGQKTMGAFLKEKYQADYYPISITSGGGSYMAASDYSQKNWKSYELERPYVGTYEYVFSQVKPDNFFVDLSVGINEPDASWLNLPFKQLDLGYVYSGEDHYQYHGTLLKSFNGIFFIRNSNASHSLVH